VDQKGNTFNLKRISYLWAFSELKRYIPGNVWSILARGTSSLETGLEKKSIASSLIVEIELIALACYLLSFPFIAYYSWSPLFNYLVFCSGIFLILLFIFGNKITNGKLSFFSPSLNYSENIKLLLVSLITFFMFGLGTFLALVSISYLDPKNSLIIISLSIFSLLAGYVSLITPMGLGVREGVMTFYLSRFIPVSLAALVSIFSRVMLIISEIIFLSFVFIWNKLKLGVLDKIESFMSIHKYELCLWLFILLYILYFTAASFLRCDNFFAGRFDLGNMDQTVWNTIHGRIFQMTDPNATDTVSRLSFHSDFMLVLISPLYLIWSNPKMLLLLQAVVLGVGALFVFLIAKRILKHKGLALTFSAIYLLNPSLQFSNLYDFHAVTLGTTLLLATFYFFIKKRYILFLILAVLTGITKEEIWAVISLFGLAIFLRVFFENKFRLNLTKKQLTEIILGLIVFLASAITCYILIWIVIPHVAGNGHFALSYYSAFGGTASDISKNIILMPVKTVSIIASPQRINYLVQLFSPFGFISLLSPAYLIFAVPDLIINLLSSNIALREIYYQYTAAITPFILISAIYAVAFLRRRFLRIGNLLIIVYLVLATFISAYLYGPLPGARHANIMMFNDQLANRKSIDKFLSDIPSEYSIAATNNLGPHLSQRNDLYTIPVGIGQADVVIFLLNDYWAQPSLEAQKTMAKEMANDKNYIQVYKDGDFVAFEKRSLYKEPKSNPKKGQTNLFPYSITALLNRDYQKSDIVIERQVSANGNFKSFVVSFLSDGLKEYALMNVPNSQKPTGGFPVLIIDHGYIQPSVYNTVNSYKPESDYFANQGFLVLKPDYRGNGNSEIANQALMRFAYPIDVLNLITSVGNIPDANASKIFLWSHSMGGEVTLEALEVAAKNKSLSSKIQGAIFWAPVTDPVKWFSRSHLPTLPEARITPYPYSQTFQILGTPEENPELWQSLSPLNYLKDLNVPILLQHGTSDTTVPYAWSVELHDSLISLGKNVEFISYPNDTHNLPLSWTKAVEDDLRFLKNISNK
jgi:uncharacterized membrane protein/fermentation-respiration switch protein FrsA (DUF1100 family)